MPTYSLHIPPIPGQPQTVGEALCMPSSQPQRTADTIDWNKAQIGWNKGQIADLHARIEELESREHGQNQLIAHVQSEKDALAAGKISFETGIEKRLASFREQVDIQGNQIKFLEKENASIKEENSSIREENSSVMKQVDDLKEKNSSFRKQVNIQGNRIDSLEEENASLKEQVKFNDGRITFYQRRIAHWGLQDNFESSKESNRSDKSRNIEYSELQASQGSVDSRVSQQQDDC